jgi:hypothetical protein
MDLLGSLFDNISRIGNDNMDLTNRNIQNTNAANYQLKNYKVGASMQSTIDLATKQPNIFYKGANEGDIDGRLIDANSKLKLAKHTRTKERNILSKRQFASVPYLGKGKRDIENESSLIYGDYVSGKKTEVQNGETNYLSYAYTPLLPELEHYLNNPSNCVESAASSDWIRGGYATRELNREQNSKAQQ